MSPFICFVENLTLTTWFFSVLPYLLAKRRRGGVTSICYFFEGSHWGTIFARVTAQLASVPLEQLRFRLTDVYDEKGILMRLRIAYQDLADYQMLVRQEPHFAEFIHNNVHKDRLPLFVVKNLVAGGFLDQASVWRAIYLIQVGIWKLRMLGQSNVQSILFVEQRPWLTAIEKYAASYGIKIKSVGFGTWIDLRRWGGNELASLFSLLTTLWRGRLQIFSRGVSSSAFPKKINAPYSIAAQYYGQFNLDRPELYSDLQFWQQSDLDGKNVLVLFALPQDPLDDLKLRMLSLQGLRAVAMRLSAAQSTKADVYLDVNILRRLSLFVTHLFTTVNDGAWLKGQIQEYNAQRDYWLRFFKSHNVRVYTTWYKYDASHIPFADALRELGGVMTIYQRAYESHPSAETMLGVDVLFGFSKVGAEVERRSNSEIAYHVVTGYMGDHRFPLLRTHAKQIRTRLEQNGAKHIIAFFDENTVEDPRWYTGHDFAREDYVVLLERVLNDSTLGLVVKPKVSSTLRRRLGAVAELLVRAESTGRCYVFEGGALHNSFPPAVAALAADVAIHQELWAATAGVEAALAGVPTLLLDRDGWTTSPFYRLGIGKVVFTDWQSLWQAFDEYRARVGGIPGFGDWSPLFDELDPFRDGRAAERMGTYLKWLIEGYELGLSREKILADAAERYCKLWGSDKVTEVKPNLPYLNSKLS